MILRYLRPRDWALVAATAVLVFLAVFFELEIPGYMSSITTTIENGGSVDDVVSDGLMMLACAFGSLIVSILVGAIAARVAASFARRIRELEFDRVQSFSMEEIGRFSTASLITRSTNDVTQVQNTIAIGMVVLIRAPIMAVWAINKISDKNWEWTLATAVAVVVLLSVILAIMFYVVPRFKRIQWLTDNVNRTTRENLTGIRVVHAYNAEGYQEGKFEEANRSLTDTNLSANRAMAFLMPTMMSGMSFLSLSIYVIGAGLISAAGVTEKLGIFANMIVFSSYAMQVVMAFVMIVVILMVLPRAMVAARRIEEVIDTEPSIRDGGSLGPGSRDGTVEFRDVSFRYPGASEDTLSGISFKASKGETVAIVGVTGCGKTTMVNLVPRFYDATGGQVLVDGMDVREYDLESLRSRIGYVSQKPTMFGGTVDYNVRYGDMAGSRTSEDVDRAIGISQASDVVANMGGTDARVAQGGTNLSGGQKQRLSIARAVCKDPEIMIFDDSFSALDYRTDRTLRAALDREMAGTTRIIVAQRVGTIMGADRILVLEDGRIVGSGTHGELLRTCPEYLDIARSQMSDEELGL